eukprot:TRINITY_DN1383_c0_g1_i2.p1 TRINITY_DN1383_c0_g1~~TRINITY_DN1383_c0_g1_i2.p1  ORF type:complete len:224 (+),score=26.06 TRINITY_DN1383_c0_g1_i2:22-693(+)
MARFLLGCVVLLTLLPAVFGVSGYVFPTRWTAVAVGTVADVLTNFELSKSTAWSYTDYELLAQRVDEVWNVISIQNTGLRELGITSDSHFFYGGGKTNYLAFTNSSGDHCFPSASGYTPQKTFAGPDAFVGTTTFEGIAVNQYNASDSDGLAQSLYVSIETQNPVGMYVTLAKYQLTSIVRYYDFEEVTSFADPTLFAVPKPCTTSQGTPPSANIHSLLRRRF